MTKSVGPAFKVRQSPAKSRADQGPLNTLIRLHWPELYWRRIIRLQYKSGHYRETETRKVSCSGDHRKSAWKKALSVISKSHTKQSRCWCVSQKERSTLFLEVCHIASSELSSRLLFVSEVFRFIFIYLFFTNSGCVKPNRLKRPKERA